MADEMTIEQIALQARREYHKQWRQKNKARVAEYNKLYWQRKAEQIAEEMEVEAPEE